LTERHGYRIAVIMNEFGDTAVSFLLGKAALLALPDAVDRILKVRLDNPK
jgi:G3E family GTPase